MIHLKEMKSTRKKQEEDKRRKARKVCVKQERKDKEKN